MKLSVIIPTHKRPQILQECLLHLEQQTVADDIEAIVVSDGPDEQAASVCAQPRKIPVEFYSVEKSQQGVARNKGVEKANGDVCLFIGDDAFLASNACEMHIRAHSSQLTAVLGFTTWDPAVGITPVMQWLEQSGWQFGYPMIERYIGKAISSEIQHRYTYTINISLPTEIAKKYPFRSDVSLYGWEDIEWGMRLRDAGITLVYAKNAKALHHHRVTLEESLKRMETLGESAVRLKRNVPELDRVPVGWKLAAYKICSFFPTMSGKHRKAFLRGMKKALADS